MSDDRLLIESEQMPIEGLGKTSVEESGLDPLPATENVFLNRPFSVRTKPKTAHYLSVMASVWGLDSKSELFERMAEVAYGTLGTTSPTQEAASYTVKAQLMLSDDVLKQHFIEHGRPVARNHHLEIPVSRLSAEARKLLWELMKANPSVIDLQTVRAALTDGDTPFSAVKYYSGSFFASLLPQTPKDWEILLAEYQVALDKQEKMAVATIHQEARRVVEKLRAQFATDALGPDTSTFFPRHLDRGILEYYSPELRETLKAYDAQQAEKDVKWKHEQHAWIEKFGSNHLKRAIHLGYEALDLYLAERSAHEFPGFHVLRSGVDYRSVTNPGEYVLEIAELTGGTVMEFTYQDGDPEDPYVRSLGQGVLIPWLGRYYIYWLATEALDKDALSISIFGF